MNSVRRCRSQGPRVTDVQSPPIRRWVRHFGRTLVRGGKRIPQKDACLVDERIGPEPLGRAFREEPDLYPLQAALAFADA